jgi:ParB family transcriptional regulator, chromosome partitioning protein
VDGGAELTELAPVGASTAPPSVPESTKLGDPMGGLETLPLTQIEEDATFRLRPEGDVAGLAQSIARSGQLVPVEVRLRGPGRWQLVTGFRRIAALKLLRRDRVLARLHDDLGDAGALDLALVDDLAHRTLSREELEAVRETLMARSWYGAAAQETVERALGEAPPPPEPEELDLDVFSRDLVARLAELSGDLASVFDAWADVEPAVQEQIRAQLRYNRDLLPFLEGAPPGSSDDSSQE